MRTRVPSGQTTMNGLTRTSRATSLHEWLVLDPARKQAGASLFSPRIA